MDYVAIEVLQENGRKDTLIVGGKATWGQLRAVFNQVDGLIVIAQDAEQPADEIVLAGLAERGSVIRAAGVRLQFFEGAAAMAAIAMTERRPDPSTYALSVLPDFNLKDFQVQEMPDHQPRFNSRDFRRQAKCRPPKKR